MEPRTETSSRATSAGHDDHAPVTFTKIGRYVVLDELGRGGMGRVLRAHDPKLDRQVAIKLMLGPELDPSLTRRLIREAQAMATLSHPNVVEVYDVVELGRSDVALVMEYVPGCTLTVWLRERSRPWRQVVEQLLAVGRGLAAAHHAGILHRDFKPDNVLVGRDGRARVGDFGLAGELTSVGESTPQLEATSVMSATSSTTMRTATGCVVGTLPYMAPERLLGEPADASTDQFAFCVSMWQALFGVRPFPGHTTIELATVMVQPPRPPRHGPRVPARIIDALRRGLSFDPDARWPSMDALLTALAPSPARARRRWRAAATLSTVAVVAGAWTWLDGRGERCTVASATEHLRGVWDDARRAEVRRGVLAVSDGYGAPVWTRTEHELDAYASAWTQMHADACAATTIRGDQPASVMDQRMECLARARFDLEAVTRVLADADAQTVQRAHTLLADLRPLHRCADLQALGAEVEPPRPDQTEAVARARAQLAGAEAARKAGRYPQAREKIEAARSALVGIDYGPIQTELAYFDGLLLRDLDEFEPARRQLVEAWRSASTWRQADLLREAAISLVSVESTGLHRPDEAQHWIDIADELADDDSLSRARLSLHRAGLLDERGKYIEAEQELRSALSLRQAHLGDDHPHVIEARGRLVSALHAQGKYDEAETQSRLVLDVEQRVLGPDHPLVARTHQNLALILHEKGRHAESEREYRRALAVTEAAFGSEHRRVADVRNDLAAVLQAQGELGAAEREHRRALTQLERALGPDAVDVAKTRCDLAIVLASRGEFEAAGIELRRGIEVLEDTLGPQHPRVARQRHNLAYVLEDLGRNADAIIEHRRVVDALQASLRPDHPDLAQARTSLALLLVAEGRALEAREVAQAAWDRRRRDDTPPAERAHAAFALAQAWSMGQDADRERASALAEQALSDFEAAGELYAGDAELVRDWLAH